MPINEFPYLEYFLKDTNSRTINYCLISEKFFEARREYVNGFVWRVFNSFIFLRIGKVGKNFFFWFKMQAFLGK